MSAYGVVIGFLLLFPWGLLGVIVVGGAVSRLKRRFRGADPARALGLSRCLCAMAPPGKRSLQ